MRTLAWGIGFLVASSAFAAESGKPGDTWYARITGGTGKITFAGKAIAVGDVLEHEGVMETGAESSAVVYFRGKATALSLAPKTQIRLTRPDPSGVKAYEILQGVCRWNVSKSSSPTKWLRIRTLSATMGVRGTDFYATYFPTLKESEVVVFEGSVDFTNSADTRDTKLIPAGHWGGVGGRFGKQIGEPMPLSSQMLTDLKRQVDVPATVKDPESSAQSSSAH